MSVNFNIHHIFPVTLYDDFAILLNNAGFLQEATGNKIGLLVEQTVIDALRGIPGIETVLAKAGFGLGVHDSNHPDYIKFLRGEFTDIKAAIDAVLR